MLKVASSAFALFVLDITLKISVSYEFDSDMDPGPVPEVIDMSKVPDSPDDALHRTAVCEIQSVACMDVNRTRPTPLLETDPKFAPIKVWLTVTMAG
jgi:hypothetical protein